MLDAGQLLQRFHNVIERRLGGADAIEAPWLYALAPWRLGALAYVPYLSLELDGDILIGLIGPIGPIGQTEQSARNPKRNTLRFLRPARPAQIVQPPSTGWSCYGFGKPLTTVALTSPFACENSNWFW